MSVLQYPERINSNDVQMWDNSSFDSDCSKENVRPLCNFTLPKPERMSKGGVVLDEQSLDFEIEKIEKEISKLSLMLERLRLEKAKRNVKVMEKRGRIVAAKFMNPPKELTGRSEDEKLRTPRRGMSLGPAEIMRGLKQFGGKQEITPIQSGFNRRQSCYWKVNAVDELRVTKERGKSMSVSPKTRCKTVDRPQITKQAVTTIGVKKMGKKECGVTSLIRPKKLFVSEGEQSGVYKSAVKGGRVVTSRYSQGSGGGGLELKKSDKNRVPLVAKCGVVPRIKACDRLFTEDDESVCEALCFDEEKHTNEYPKLRVLQSIDESLQGSEEVKRVPQLVGKNTVFATDDDKEMPVFSFMEIGD